MPADSRTEDIRVPAATSVRLMVAGVVQTANRGLVYGLPEANAGAIVHARSRWPPGR